MVGLSVVLETSKSSSNTGGVISPKTPHVLNKTSVLITAAGNRSAYRHKSCSPESYFPSTAFLEHCFLCKQRLLPGKDIYMYKGDRAFCSVECRSRQMFMDEEESLKKGNCSLVAIKTSPSATFPSLTPPSSAGYSRRGTGEPRNRAGGFAY